MLKWPTVSNTVAVVSVALAGCLLLRLRARKPSVRHLVHRKPRLVALEEHVMSPEQQRKQQEMDTFEFTTNAAKLLDINGRLRRMLAVGVDIVVLSMTAPGLQAVRHAAEAAGAARRFNTWLARQIALCDSPSSARAFASLPMRFPREAATELSYAVKALGCVGALVNGWDTSGWGDAPVPQPAFYDTLAYLPFWRTVETLGVPVYLHPRRLDAQSGFFMEYPFMRHSPWGFHIGMAQLLLRLMLAGVFDACPNLQLIVGHMGEVVAFLASRIDHRMRAQGVTVKARFTGKPLRHTITHYVRHNLYITTSGFSDTAALQHLLSVVGPSRVMFSIDSPYESIVDAVTWLQKVPLKPCERRLVATGNACALLRLGSGVPCNP